MATTMQMIPTFTFAGEEGKVESEVGELDATRCPSSDFSESEGDGDLSPERIVPSAWSMAFTSGGSRIVQTAFDVGSAKDREDVAMQFRGHVADAARCPHANFVLQKCIVMMPPDKMQFVLQELQGCAAALAQDRYGCHVMERVIEHFPGDQTANLVDEILSGGPNFIKHIFAKYVVLRIFERGTETQRRQIVEMLKSDAMTCYMHWVANKVLECLIVLCTESK